MVLFIETLRGWVETSTGVAAGVSGHLRDELAKARATANSTAPISAIHERTAHDVQTGAAVEDGLADLDECGSAPPA